MKARHDLLMDEATIREFWNTHPCGEEQVRRLDDTSLDDFERFFDVYDELKYRLERHIPACLDALGVAGKRVLEIGPGEGTESEQLIRRGARWTGIDLTPESVERVRTRLALRGLPFDEIHRGTVRRLPFADGAFDMVFSHGVLHHVPDIEHAQHEIHRVLHPGGELVVMMYARWSLNYLIAIGAVRRAAVLAAYPLLRRRPLEGGGMLEAHVRNAREIGLRNYLSMRTFIHANTDGPKNPFSRVYDRKRLQRDFSMFTVTKTYKHFMHAPPLPVHGLPGGSLVGWHLWAHLRPV
jgi:SAM-dependent methyltransferase